MGLPGVNRSATSDVPGDRDLVSVLMPSPLRKRGPPTDTHTLTCIQCPLLKASKGLINEEPVYLLQQPDNHSHHVPRSGRYLSDRVFSVNAAMPDKGPIDPPSLSLSNQYEEGTLDHKDPS